MTKPMPIVELLAGCDSNHDRMAWLLAVPIAIIQRDYLDIRAILADRGFTAGIHYLDAELAALNCRRMLDGTLPFLVAHTINLMRIDMAIAVRRTENLENGETV